MEENNTIDRRVHEADDTGELHNLYSEKEIQEEIRKVEGYLQMELKTKRRTNRNSSICAALGALAGAYIAELYPLPLFPDAIQRVQEYYGQQAFDVSMATLLGGSIGLISALVCSLQERYALNRYLRVKD
ncbi:MAG: hypothetical protein V1743_08175 [Nanoarchaeota archaeon]